LGDIRANLAPRLFVTELLDTNWIIIGYFDRRGEYPSQGNRIQFHIGSKSSTFALIAHLGAIRAVSRLPGESRRKSPLAI
jgi:hypothetical protein